MKSPNIYKELRSYIREHSSEIDAEIRDIIKEESSGKTICSQ